MIKQVIDGKAYNTETARCLTTVDLMGYRMDGRGRFTTNTPKKVGSTSLYETRGGGYFLVRDYDPTSDIADPDLAGQLRIHDRGVIPLKREEALGWAESKALDSDKIEEMFRKVAEAGDEDSGREDHHLRDDRERRRHPRDRRRHDEAQRNRE